MLECEQSAAKQETASTLAVKAETEEEASASSVPRGASAAGNEDSSGEQHAERQQSENREATVMTSAVKEADNEEELNVEESLAGGNDHLVQPTNDGTGDDGNGSLVIAPTKTSVPTADIAGGKKRSRDAASSTRNVRAQTRSKKEAKLSHSTVHATSEETDTTAQPRVVRRSARRAATKVYEGAFEGTSRGIEMEEEADDEFMPVVKEDGPPVDDGDNDHDEDGNKIIVAECAQQVRSPYKSFDKHFKALMGFKEKFGHFNVPRKTTGEYKSLGQWCNQVRTSYKKIQKRETPYMKLTEDHIRQLEDAGFK